MKNINTLRWWSTNASNVDGTQPPLNFFWSTFIFFIKITYILNRSNNRRIFWRQRGKFTKVDHICQFADFQCLEYYYLSNMWKTAGRVTSWYYMHWGSKQHIFNSNSEAKYVYRSISGHHQYQFWTILHQRN